MSDESDHAIEQAELAAWDAAKQEMDDAMFRQNIEYHDRIRDLEAWVRETISLWKRGDIKTAHIQRGQLLLED